VTCFLPRRLTASLPGVAAALALLSLASTTSAQQKPLAYAPTESATVSGSLEVTNGRVAIGSHATLTAGDETVPVTLTRGGQIDVCRSTTVQISTDSTLGKSRRPGDDAIMLALDHGAIEEHGKPGKYSDVILTPDLRILVSGPGKANLSLRVGVNGDTCIDNHGSHAPYVTVTNLFTGGVYRVQPNQRVLIESGDTSRVVDNEPEPCGCPPPPTVLAAGLHHGAHRHAAAHATKAEKENPFPLAESEGLKPPPAPAGTPAVPVGQVQAEVEAPITYNSAQPEPATPAAKPARGESTASSGGEAAVQTPHRHRGFFGSIGHFFAHLFGRK
jgi:hypothetical protein